MTRVSSRRPRSFRSLISAAEGAGAVEHVAPGFRIDSLGVGKVEHRVLAGTETDPLVFARQETRTPEPREEGLVRAIARTLRDHDHERRQVLVLRPEAVAEP